MRFKKLRDSFDIGFSREIERGIHLSGSEFFDIIPSHSAHPIFAKQDNKLAVSTIYSFYP